MEIIPELEDTENIIAIRTCQYFIQWKLYVRKNNQFIKYEDLYEPIIRFYERGGGHIVIRKGYLDTNCGGFSISHWRGNISFESIDISDDALDKYDTL